MKPRMLCTECFQTSHPETSLAGSDRIEMAGWLCFTFSGVLATAWLVRGSLLWLRTRSRLQGARAWTRDGRPIPIEVA